MVLQEVGWDMDWIALTHDRDRSLALVNMVMNPRVPQKSRNVLTSWGPVSFSGKTLLRGVSNEFLTPHFHCTSITTTRLQSNVNCYIFEVWGSRGGICKDFCFLVSQCGNFNMPKEDCHFHAFMRFTAKKLGGMDRSWGSLSYWSLYTNQTLHTSHLQTQFVLKHLWLVIQTEQQNTPHTHSKECVYISLFVTQSNVITHFLPYHSWNPVLQTSQCGKPGLIPGQYKRNLCWRMWHWDRFLSEHVDTNLSVTDSPVLRIH